MPLPRNVECQLEQALLGRYREAEDQLKTHLNNLLTPFSFIAPAEIASRVAVRRKPKENIVEKVDRTKPRQMASLRQLEHKGVTDIVGGRVVLDYLHQVREFCKNIRICGHWTVVKDNRGRVKRDTGYRSRHIDVVLTATTNHQDIRCEIQVRSLLQHAFASWSHPVYAQYRENTRAVPDLLRGKLIQVSDQINSIDKGAEKLHKDVRRVIDENKQTQEG